MPFPLRRIVRPAHRHERRRDQRGVAFPSPLVLLSIVAVAMAGIAFVATGGSEDPERDITPVAQPESSPSATADDTTAQAQPKRKRKQGREQAERRRKKKKEERTAVHRGEVLVEVYNNSGITGLAGRTAEKARDIGWQVVATDNWYGTIPGATVYHPQRLERAAETLARDLGIDRVQPAVDPMRRDRLTVILTGQG